MTPAENLPFPPSPPPNISPTSCHGFNDAIPKFLRQHMRMYIYVWMYTGQSFWMYPVSLNNERIYGHIWNGQRWVYTRFFWNSMESFA